MKAEWIWLADDRGLKSDVHASFKKNFTLEEIQNVSLRVSCDSLFCAYINGDLVGFSGCADYPHYKLYDEMDITNFCSQYNELEILVWYFGENSQTYLLSDPGLWFEVSSGGVIVSTSDENVLGRLDDNYKQAYNKIITTQLGFSFYYDNTYVNKNPFLPCKIIQKLTPIKRPQKNIYLDERVNVKYERRENYLLVDFGCQYAGYLDLDFESPCEQEILISYGEHLETGEVSRLIGGRDFSFEFKAKKGRNTWFVPLRRLAGRYLQVNYMMPIEQYYIGIRPAYYPVSELTRHFDDPLLQKIYDVSVRTLRLCMHEHYEDTPWREQALYALDSRNQILFGYAAFGETEYVRSNLLLINHGLRPDGLLSICFPAGKDHPIPFFSLAYILAICEYVKYSNDRTIIEETKKTVETIVKTFITKIDDTGLIPSFPYPFWNFYEWSEGNSGNLSRKADDPYEKDYDLILNAFFVYVLKVYNELAGTDFSTENIKTAIHKNLYVEKCKLYKISRNGSLLGQLGNALAVLAGLGNEETLEKIALCSDSMTPITLSMKPFLYDALLTSGDKYKSFIIDDIKQVYGKMLDYGATSFWETELGWSDFDRAGSLCHGWSAAPAHYLVLLCN